MELQRACLPCSIAAVVWPSGLVTRHDGPICSMSSRRNPYGAIFSLWLRLLHNLQYVREALIIDDVTLIDRAELAVDGIGDRGARCT